MTETTAPAPRPRIRWGAIVWGVITGSTALTTLLVIGSRERRVAFLDWLTGLTTGGIVLLVALVVGGVILLLGLLALARHAQRERPTDL